jgi:hypothetical protein
MIFPVDTIAERSSWCIAIAIPPFSDTSGDSSDSSVTVILMNCHAEKRLEARLFIASVTKVTKLWIPYSQRLIIFSLFSVPFQTLFLAQRSLKDCHYCHLWLEVLDIWAFSR